MALPLLTRASDADALAPLPAPGREDRAPGPGAHAQAEPMRLRPVAVVRLKSTLTHWNSRCGRYVVNGLMISTGTGGSLELRRPRASVVTNNRRAGTHPSHRPYLRQAVIQLHRDKPDLYKLRARQVAVKPGRMHSPADRAPAGPLTANRGHHSPGATHEAPVHPDDPGFANGARIAALGCG